MDAPYAPASPIAMRSPRRRGGRSWSPRASVDSQIGPSTRVGRCVQAAPDEDVGRRDHAQIGGRSSYGMDSTVVVWVDTLPSDRIRASSASRWVIDGTWTLSR